MKKLNMFFGGCFLIAAMSFTACGNSGTGIGATEQQDTSAALGQQDTSAALPQDANAAPEQQGTSAALGQQDTSAALPQDTNAAPEQQTSSAALQSKQETLPYDNNKYASIADYIASDEVQASIKLFSGMEGLDIKLKAEGNKMIYEYTYTTIAKQSGMENALKSVLEGQKSIFINAANALKNEVNIDNPVVTVTYLDKNGDLIYSQDFPAN